MNLTIFLFCYLVYIILGFFDAIYNSTHKILQGISKTVTKDPNSVCLLATFIVVGRILIFGPFFELFANICSFLRRK